MKVTLLQSENELIKIAPTLCQLRPQYSQEQLIVQILKQQQNGYQIAYVEEEDTVICVAGFVISEKLAWGKSLYIDDLVTNQECRSRGAGKRILDWLKDYAHSQQCNQIHLDSGVQRFAAHRFYLREGFNIASHHFSITE